MNNIRKIEKFDNLTGLAKISRTAGGFYMDIKSINGAVSEARLESGMVENKVYQNLYDKHKDMDTEQEIILAYLKEKYYIDKK